MTRYLVTLVSPVLMSVEVEADTEAHAVLQAVGIFRDDVTVDDLRAAPIEVATKRYKQVAE